MKLSIPALAVALAFGAGYAAADTTSSEQDRTTMERKASPSNDAKQDEEQAEAHGQPDSQTPGGSSDSSSSTSTGSSSAPASGDAKGKTDKPTSGDYYQSNENKADSTKSQSTR